MEFEVKFEMDDKVVEKLVTKVLGRRTDADRVVDVVTAISSFMPSLADFLMQRQGLQAQARVQGTVTDVSPVEAGLLGLPKAMGVEALVAAKPDLSDLPEDKLVLLRMAQSMLTGAGIDLRGERKYLEMYDVAMDVMNAAEGFSGLDYDVQADIAHKLVAFFCGPCECDDEACECGSEADECDSEAGECDSEAGDDDGPAGPRLVPEE